MALKDTDILFAGMHTDHSIFRHDKLTVGGHEFADAVHDVFGTVNRFHRRADRHKFVLACRPFVELAIAVVELVAGRLAIHIWSKRVNFVFTLHFR